MTDVDDEDEEVTPPPTKKKPPPLIRADPSSSCHIRLKKKMCPDCSTSITSKCKICQSGGKCFEVFTFGRKLCPVCGHINQSCIIPCF